MSTGTITPYRSGQRPGRDDFPHLLRAEWTKFRTVRGWVIAMAAAALLTAAGRGGPRGRLRREPDRRSSPGRCHRPGRRGGHRQLLLRAPVTGRQRQHHRPGRLAGHHACSNAGSSPPHIAIPWAKAGIIIKAGTRPGSAYAAVMATPAHGVRMQYGYTHDTAGLPGAVSAASPRWLRLTRSGGTITGFDSADGRHWAEIGTASLAGLPPTVQAGLFVTSPRLQAPACPPGAICPPGSPPGQSFASNATLVPYTTRATAAFDHVSLRGERPAAGGGVAGSAWRGGQIGFPTGTPLICTPSPGHSCPRTRPAASPNPAARSPWPEAATSRRM